MAVSVARIPTGQAERYLQQLCKHFAHRLEVSLQERHGRIVFGAGSCVLDADPATLTLRAEAAGEDGLREVEGVVARHLERFAFRESLAITWNEGV